MTVYYSGWSSDGSGSLAGKVVDIGPEWSSSVLKEANFSQLLVSESFVLSTYKLLRWYSVIVHTVFFVNQLITMVYV